MKRDQAEHGLSHWVDKYLERSLADGGESR